MLFAPTNLLPPPVLHFFSEADPYFHPSFFVGPLSMARVLPNRLDMGLPPS